MKLIYARIAGLMLASGYFLHYAFTPNDWHAIDIVNLIFHEAGHTIFFFLGEYMRVLMGSGFQILLPLSIALYFFRTRQPFSGAICLMWAGQNLINVSVYAGDAIAMQLPLLGGDAVIHDWNYLLYHAHILQFTPIIAHALYSLGVFTILLGIMFAAWFIWQEYARRTSNHELLSVQQ